MRSHFQQVSPVRQRNVYFAAPPCHQLVSNRTAHPPAWSGVWVLKVWLVDLAATTVFQLVIVVVVGESLVTATYMLQGTVCCL